MGASAPLPHVEPSSPERDAERLIFARAFARLDPLGLGVAVGAVTGFAIFLSTAVLIMRGGENVGYHLQRLGYYLPGYTVTWGGALLGFIEVAGLFFVLASCFALVWNGYHSIVLRLAMGSEMRREIQDL